MERTLFAEEHQMFREAYRRFVEKELAPHHEDWEKAGIVSRDVWLKAGEYGFLGMDVPETYGGGGIKGLPLQYHHGRRTCPPRHLWSRLWITQRHHHPLYPKLRVQTNRNNAGYPRWYLVK